jgi:hypothetical protein
MMPRTISGAESTMARGQLYLFCPSGPSTMQQHRSIASLQTVPTFTVPFAALFEGGGALRPDAAAAAAALFDPLD